MSFRNERKDQGGERVVQAIPGQTVGKDVKRKIKKLLQYQTYTEYTSVAHKILKYTNKEGGKKLLPGLGQQLGTHVARRRTQSSY